MSDGFLGRWSRRKLEVKQGKAVEAEAVPELPPSPQPSPASGRGSESALGAAGKGGESALGAAGKGGESATAGASGIAPSPLRGEGGGEGLPELPPPTLEDVRSLTAESDFTRFAAPDVAPEVKNAALKRLFSDPRYNVMDGLDVYIDDYSKPDPIPAAMLRQLAGAKFLGLFEQEERVEEAARRPRDVADNPTAQSVAQSGTVPPAVTAPPEDADPDLRLQQDHAAPGEDPGRGTG